MFTLERFGTISAPQQSINSCSHCIGATFETGQNPIRYSVNIAYVLKEVTKRDNFARDPIFGGSCVPKSLPQTVALLGSYKYPE